MLMGAIMIAAVGIIMNLRPSKLEERLDERLNKAEWIMKQDEKNLAKVKQEELHHQESLKAYLDNHHMKGAQGSIRRARYMLDMAREYRSQKELKEQNKQALNLQESSLRAALKSLEDERASAFYEVGLLDHARLEDIELRIQQKEDERNATIKLSNETLVNTERFIKELQQAQHRQSFRSI